MKRSGMHIVAVLIGLLIVAGFAAAAPRVKITVLAESPVEMTLQARADAPGCAFAWRLDGAGALRGNLNSATVLYVFPTDDSAQARRAALTVTATDKAGQTASANKTIALPATVTPTPKPTPKPTATPAPTLPKEWKDPVTGMEFVYVPEGCFQMGSTDYENEQPVHKVCLDGFLMGKYEVMQAQWKTVMGDNPSSLRENVNNPVENVSWDDAQLFLRKLNAKIGESLIQFRLPSEAEWEYACRAGSQTAYSFGESALALGEYAWYSENSEHTHHPVGQKKPNNFGIYDMHGNVKEWCADDYYENYNNAPQDGSPRKDEFHQNTSRILRGGWHNDVALEVRCAARDYGTHDFRNGDNGFRVVAVPLRTE